MFAYRAKLGCFLTDHDMAAVQALPHAVAVLREYRALLNVLNQLAVSVRREDI